MTFGRTILSLTLFAAASFAQDCSTASLTGPFGFTVKGTVTNENNRPITSSQVGRIAFDGKGAFTGFSASTSGAKVNVGEFTGQISIGSDCTATGKSSSAGGSLDFDLVVVNGGNDFALVFRASDSNLSGYGTKIEGQGSCTAATLNGNYGYQGEGVIAIDGRAVSTAEVGILTFDGKGGVAGTYSNIAGGQATRQSFTGIYEMVPEACFASAAYKIGDLTYQLNFMITSGGNQILYSELASGYVMTGSGVRTVVR